MLSQGPMRVLPCCRVALLPRCRLGGEVPTMMGRFCSFPALAAAAFLFSSRSASLTSTHRQQPLCTQSTTYLSSLVLFCCPACTATDFDIGGSQRRRATDRLFSE